MKRTDLVNYLNGVWPVLFGVCLIMTSETMQGVAFWQKAFVCVFGGALVSIVPQFGFNWLQTGHSWANDKGEIIRAFKGGWVTIFICLFSPVGNWMWISAAIILPVNIVLWKWGGKIFKAK